MLVKVANSTLKLLFFRGSTGKADTEKNPYLLLAWVTLRKNSFTVERGIITVFCTIPLALQFSPVSLISMSWSRFCPSGSSIQIKKSCFDLNRHNIVRLVSIKLQVHQRTLTTRVENGLMKETFTVTDLTLNLTQSASGVRKKGGSASTKWGRAVSFEP